MRLKWAGHIISILVQKTRNILTYKNLVETYKSVEQLGGLHADWRVISEWT
jgi:hypothetical protein